MTSLTGEFHTDLSLDDTIVACAEAIDGLGWRIENVEPNRIVSYANTASTEHAPKVEVTLNDSGQTTDVRIIGTDTAAHPISEDELIAELDRVRDAIKSSTEDMVDGTKRSRTPGPQESAPAAVRPREGGETRTRAPLASAAGWLARLIRLAAWVLAGIIVAGILFIVLDANPSNSIVLRVHDAARWLVGPFSGMFKPDDRKLAVAINWGIAALVYVIVGSLIAYLVARVGSAGLRRRRTGAT